METKNLSELFRLFTGEDLEKGGIEIPDRPLFLRVNNFLVKNVFDLYGSPIDLTLRD